MTKKDNETNLPERSGSVAGMEDNLKKAVAEMLVLFLLQERDMYIGEIPEELNRRSDGTFQLVFPYSIIYRMVKFEYIDECKKRTAPDGRRRQYYTITQKGREYLSELRQLFERFSVGINTIFASEGETYVVEECECEEVYETDAQRIDVQFVEETGADERTKRDCRDFSGRVGECFV